MLEAYGDLSGSQLEELLVLDREDPWIQARWGYRPTQRCENEIDEKQMATYYQERHKKQS